MDNLIIREHSPGRPSVAPGSEEVDNPVSGFPGRPSVAPQSKEEVPNNVAVPLNPGIPGNKDKQLSPGTEQKLNRLIEDLHSGKATLEEDENHHIQTKYQEERVTRLSDVDPSQAWTVQKGTTKEDTEMRSNVFLEYITAILQKRVPSGVVVDDEKTVVSPKGQYEPGTEFELVRKGRTSDSCDEGTMIARDKVTGKEHLIKKRMIAESAPNGMKAWMCLNDLSCIPDLYLFQLKGNSLYLHQEHLKDAVTIQEIISRHMKILRKARPELVRKFSLCVFLRLLEAMEQIHKRKWSHEDIHGGNVLLEIHSMEVKIIDFDEIKPLKGLISKKDVLDVVRLFTLLYIRQDFVDHENLEQKIVGNYLEKVLSQEVFGLTKEHKEELIELISMTYRVMTGQCHEGYGSSAFVKKFIEDRLSPETPQAIMAEVSLVLFGGGDIRDLPKKRERGAAKGAEAGAQVEEAEDRTDLPTRPQELSTGKHEELQHENFRSMSVTEEKKI